MDLGLDWMVSKGGENFVGKFGLERTDLVRPDRLQLVGLESNGHNRQLPHGGYLIASADRELPPPHHVIGHVTSTCMSPILERPIALALIERGRERHGETVICPSGRERIEARIVEPTFYDKDGERQNV
jgi:sarcosine oxidase subunit alpha